MSNFVSDLLQHIELPSQYFLVCKTANLIESTADFDIADADLTREVVLPRHRVPRSMKGRDQKVSNRRDLC